MFAIGRRRFLVHTGLLATGAAAGYALRELGSPGGAAFAQAPVPPVPPTPPSAEARLKELGIELPPPSKAIATFVPAVRTGNLLFVSGHISRRADGKPLTGKLGATLETAAGAAAAHTCALGVLTSVRAALGSLDKVARVVKTLGMVNATPEFNEHPQVINGFSDLFVELYGPELGKGARSAVGMASLPLGAAVEVEIVFEVR